LVDKVLLLLAEGEANFKNASWQKSLTQLAFIGFVIKVLVQVLIKLVDLIAGEQFLKVKGDRAVLNKDNSLKF